jgi:Lrp/AsnC family leucine-responsive transcriptional regulator
MQSVTGARSRNRGPDPLDERILRLLVRDARASYTDMGVAVGLSANAVAQRVRRLERSGLIRGYRADLDPAVDGGAVGALVYLRTAIDADADALEAGLAALPEVVEVLDLAGPVDYQVRLRCAEQPALYDVVQLIRALPGVTAMETRPILRDVLRR